MDDFTLSTLQESRNEWCCQLVNIITPLIIEGYNSIFKESWLLCEDQNETDKYLMTFQNFIRRVPQWNSTTIEKERTRIMERSNCAYLEDLLTCVHVIQLKLLTCIRAGKEQRKVNINIPKLDDFIHKCYILVARKLYTNVYIYDRTVSPLQKQKHNREFEIIVQECILNAIRENMPIQELLRTYLDESIEEDVQETIKEENIEIEDDEPQQRDEDASKNGIVNHEVPIVMDKELDKTITFNNTDSVKDEDGQVDEISAPKTIERLEEISALRNADQDDDDDEDNLQIAEDVDISTLGIEDISPKKQVNAPIVLDDIEILV